MAGEELLELARPNAGVAKSEQDGPKTILLHVQDDSTIQSRLETALGLARTFSSHLECLHITPIQAYVAYEGLGGLFVMNKVIEALEEQEAKLRTRIEQEIGNEDISWSYGQVTGDTVNQLVCHAALADLVVVGREEHQGDGNPAAVGLLGDLLERSRTPVLIPGDSNRRCDPLAPAVIAWDGSYEAANAVRASIGMLKRASEVLVVQVEEGKFKEFPGTRLLQFLSRHGIHAELIVDRIDDLEQDMIPDVLVTRAMAAEAAYIVMGGYNHRRIREFVFGGVTRSMLSWCPVPVIMTR